MIQALSQALRNMLADNTYKNLIKSFFSTSICASAMQSTNRFDLLKNQDTCILVT